MLTSQIEDLQKRNGELKELLAQSGTSTASLGSSRPDVENTVAAPDGCPSQESERADLASNQEQELEPKGDKMHLSQDATVCEKYGDDDAALDAFVNNTEEEVPEPTRGGVHPPQDTITNKKNDDGESVRDGAVNNAVSLSLLDSFLCPARRNSRGSLGSMYEEDGGVYTRRGSRGRAASVGSIIETEMDFFEETPSFVVGHIRKTMLSGDEPCKIFEVDERTDFFSVCKKNAGQAFSSLRDKVISELVPFKKKYPRRLTSSESPIPLEHRGITMTQLCDFSALAESIITSRIQSGNTKNMTKWESTTLEELSTRYIVPLIRPHQCSFVELVTSSPQVPVWFVSHWMGGSFTKFMKVVTFHNNCRKTSEDDPPYWIRPFGDPADAHADELAVEKFTDTTSARVLKSSVCTGSLLVVDEGADTFGRAWCIFEYFLSLNSGIVGKKMFQHRIDVGTLTHGRKRSATSKEMGVALLLLNNGRFLDQMEIEGTRFPDELLLGAMSINVRTSSTKHAHDKRNILRLIYGQCHLLAEPPLMHKRYDEANTLIWRYFSPRALYGAARSGWYGEVERLLELDLTPADEPNALKTTPLCAAVSYNHSDVVDLLLNHQADPSSARCDGATPLYLATQMNEIEVMASLLRARANTELCTSDHQRPITKAVDKGLVDAVKLLLSARANVNGLGYKRQVTALDAAYATQHHTHMTKQEEEDITCIVNMLLEAGAKEAHDLLENKSKMRQR